MPKVKLYKYENMYGAVRDMTLYFNGVLIGGAHRNDSSNTWLVSYCGQSIELPYRSTVAETLTSVEAWIAGALKADRGSVL